MIGVWPFGAQVRTRVGRSLRPDSSMKTISRPSRLAFLPLLNFEWVGEPVFRWASGVKGGHGPAKRTLDAGCTPATLG